MTDNTDTVRRKPFKSGNSKVISVTGLPFIPSNQELAIKAVEVDGVKGCLMVPDKELSKHDLADMPNAVEFVTESVD